MSIDLILKIHQDEKYEFFHLYDALGDIQKDIWKKIVFWCKKHPAAFPCQETIAKSLKCSRKHVNRTFKKFKDFGWLSLGSRGIKKSKRLCVQDSLLQIDLVNRQYFKRVEVTSKVTHSYSSKIRTTSKEAGEIVVPHFLEKLDISKDSKLKLSLLPEKIYQETLYQCKKMSDFGWRPENEEKYFVGTAIKIAEKQGIQMDWKKYYQGVKNGIRF